MYVASKRSLTLLSGCDARLACAFVRALQIGEIDACCTEGQRAQSKQDQILDEQARTGVQKTKTQNSLHLLRPSKAIHVVPYVNSKLHYDTQTEADMAPFDLVAVAMRLAGRDIKVSLRWGGCWHLVLTDELDHPSKLRQRYAAYKAARKQKPFWDFVHYEIID